MIEVLHESQPRARKRHTCDSCLGAIEPGDRYDRQTVVDGTLYTFKAHTRCFKAARVLIDACPDSYHPYYDALPNVIDFEDEDWETIRAEAPDLYAEFLTRASGYGPTVPDETQA